MHSSAILEAYLARLYDTTTRDPLSSLEKALILITIAVGATSTSDHWRVILSTEAKKEVEKSLTDINLMAVQVELLTISSHFLHFC
jgi:hypothetical protein